MNTKPDVQTLSIVLVGNFNPRIFHPSWLAKHELIRNHEADNADIELSHNDVSIFSLEWLKLQVMLDKFSTITEQEPYFEVTRDLVCGIFRLLEHTPISGIGINRGAHIRMRSKESWNDLGHILAPKKRWEKALKQPGTMRISIRGTRKDDYNGHQNVRFEPSTRVHPGVFIEFNDHFDIDSSSTSCSDQIINILTEKWDTNKTDFEKIVDALMEGYV